MNKLSFMTWIKNVQYKWHAFARSIPTDDRRYRAGVGIILLDARGYVLMAQKHKTKMWQFPQGGLDRGEKEVTAAWREMHEEIGTQKAHLLGETTGVYRYLLPWHSLWRLRFKGQSQRWFLFLFQGCDEDIDLNCEPVPEFSSWRWVDPKEVLEVSYPKKRALYAKVLEEFAPLIQKRVETTNKTFLGGQEN